MDWFVYCKRNYDAGFLTEVKLKVYVVKLKITEAQFKEITGTDYVA